MKCPICTEVQLVMSERQGVEIDYCPTCRGIWLDRGELDKIIERSCSRQVTPPAEKNIVDNSGDTEDGSVEQQPNRSGRKESWLSNLLDFGG
jgi:Zn-finger nucleic acid-binding protein